ncbi:MAG: sodium:solute symporter family protein [Bacteroidetes bacterium]|nr:sodium:solute symporter family protein [Bacteroidota bacterium]
MNLLLIGILAFIAVQLAIGYIVSRKVRSEDDYLLAGRQLGVPLATFSIFATWFGAESCIGSAGTAYDAGLAGISSDPFGYGLCILIVGSFFARKFWDMKLVTIADYLRVRYSERSARLCALLMVPTSFLWTAAQIRAFGTVLSAVTEIDLTLAIAAATGIVLFYTSFGGMMADVITDLIQGTILITGLGMLLYFTADHLGGAASFAAHIGAGISSGAAANDMSLLQRAEQWLIPICGSIFAQELISRTLSSRSSAVAQRSALTAGVLYILVGLIPLSIGLAGASIVPGLTDGEQVLPAMASRFLTPTLYIIFTGAMISAILSTVDSTLLAISALITHNAFPMSKNLPERQKIAIDRTIVIIAGLASALFALGADGVYELVKDASAFGSAGIFVVILLGVYTKLGNDRGAIATLAGGTITWIVCYYILGLEFSYLYSLLVSFTLYFLFHFFPGTGIRSSASTA